MVRCEWTNTASIASVRLKEAGWNSRRLNPLASTRQTRLGKPIQRRKPFAIVFKLMRNAVKTHNCTRAILVGHNAHFDHGFVYAAAESHKLKRKPFHPFSVFDTATLGGLAYGQTVLSRACEEAGISFEGSSAHSRRIPRPKDRRIVLLYSRIAGAIKGVIHFVTGCLAGIDSYSVTASFQRTASPARIGTTSSLPKS